LEVANRPFLYADKRLPGTVIVKLNLDSLGTTRFEVKAGSRNTILEEVEGECDVVVVTHPVSFLSDLVDVGVNDKRREGVSKVVF
jgi:hypothetical protein